MPDAQISQLPRVPIRCDYNTFSRQSDKRSDNVRKYKTSGAGSRIRSRNYFITQIVVGSVVGGVVVGGTVVGEIVVGDDVGENVLLGFDGVCVVGVC